jgi:hypothetical protein
MPPPILNTLDGTNSPESFRRDRLLLWSSIGAVCLGLCAAFPSAAPTDRAVVVRTEMSADPAAGKPRLTIEGEIRRPTLLTSGVQRIVFTSNQSVAPPIGTTIVLTRRADQNGEIAYGWDGRIADEK